MINAVKKLKECGNPFYQDVEVDENFMNKVHPVDQAEEEAKQQEGGFADQIDNSEQIDDDEESNNPVKKFQSKQDSNTCLTPMNLDNKVITNNSSKTIKKRSVVLQEYVRPQVKILFVYHIWFLGYIKINIFALGCDQCSEKIKRMWKSVLPRC